MGKILPTDKSCPYCRKNFHDYNASSGDFGLPIRIYRYCYKEYLDRRYHEIAVEGWNDSSLNISRSLELKKEESEKILSNPAYARQLSEHGYKVTEKYL